MNPTPEDGSWLNGDQEELSIKVGDAVSGLDIDTAEYRLYFSEVEVVSEWKDVLGWEIMEEETRLVAPVPSEEAFGLYIQWKISDMAGTESVSEPFTFSIDRTPPLIDPDQDDMLVGPGEVTFDCFMEDPLSWLNLSTVEFKIGSAGTFQDSEWTAMGLEGFRVSASPSISLEPGFEGYGYAQWRVADRAGNMVEGDLISILVDRTPPEFTDFSPNSTTIQTSKQVVVTTTIVEEGSGLSSGDVEVSASTISGWVQYGVGGFSPWVPIESLEEINDNYLATATVKLDEGRFNLIRFRARDTSGNGWVISRSYSVQVDIPDVNLPPTALFNVLPVSDMIFKGDSLILDASPSLDPEGASLNFTWYSDLEGFPGTGMLGRGEKINVTLTAIGVHNIWVVVTDGINDVESEEVKIRVVDADREVEEESNEGKSFCERLRDSLLFLIIALLIGIILGAFVVYFAFARRLEPETMLEPLPMVDAKYEEEFVVPFCPYCGEESRISDDYCIKCGNVFTEKDKEDMLKGKSKKKKKGKKDSLKPFEEETEEEEWEPPSYEEEIEVESEFFAEPPRDLEIEEEEYPVEDEFEEVEELELEELDEDEWEVEE
jgi:hypothetical protein